MAARINGATENVKEPDIQQQQQLQQQQNRFHAKLLFAAMKRNVSDINVILSLHQKFMVVICI